MRTAQLRRSLNQGARVVHLARLSAALQAGSDGARRAPDAASRGTIQRVALTADAILSQIEGLDALKKHLDSVLPGESPTASDATTMRAHVKAAITNYLGNSVGQDVQDNAVSLSIALDGIAGIVSNLLYDPWMRSKLSTRLLDLYKTDLTEWLSPDPENPDADARHTTALAGVLLTGDPIGLYMHGELSEEEAVRRIVFMSRDATGALNDYQAGTATFSASDMFTLLRRRFEAQMLAYTKSAVMRREDLGVGGKRNETTGAVTWGPYSTREATGQMSVRYFDTLFQKDNPAALTDFTSQAADKLDNLGKQVSSATTAAWERAPDKDPDGLSHNEERALEKIKADDSHIKSTVNVDSALQQYAETTFGYPPAKAQKAVKALRKKLDSSPITITVPGSVFFQQGVPEGTDTEYKAATQQRHAEWEQAVLGRGEDVLHHVGAYDNPVFGGERGQRYLHFRMWKDRMMTGNLGLAPEEMPKFGALNFAWKVNYGSVSNTEITEKAAKRREKAFHELSPEDQQRRAKDQFFGENYYGEVHLVVKRSLRKQGRVVFTSTDHGAPHLDPMLAIYDAYTGSTRTNLKSTQETQLLLHAFNAAATQPVNRLGDLLKLESQIYGRLDLTSDIEQIVVAPGASDTVKKNARTFCKRHKISYLEIALNDSKLKDAKLGINNADLSNLQFR